MEITRQNELIGALDELKEETQEMQRKGLPFMMASVVVWSLILYIQMTVQDLNKVNLYAFIASCYMMPAAMIFGKFLKAPFLKKSKNPINKLGFLCTMNQNLYILIVMWACSIHPSAMIMIYAMVFGAHLLPFAWVHDNKAYMAASILETVGAMLIATKFGNIPMIMFIIVMQVTLSVILFVDTRKVKTLN